MTKDEKKYLIETVKKHTAAAYEKLGVNKKADAIAAYRKITRR